MKRIVLAIAALVACADEGGMHLTDGAPPPPPDTTSTSTSDTGTTTDTTGMEAACCADPVPMCMPSACADGFCVADRDLSRDSPPPPSSFTCRADCVPTNLVGLWCTTTATCCDAEATCDQATGLCKVPFEGTTTTDAVTSGSSDGTAAASSSSGDGDGSSSSSSTTDAESGADTTAG